MKKPENKGTKGNAQQSFGEVDSFSVDKVRVKGEVIWFTLELNGVVINNCHVVEAEKDGQKDFISLPSYKGSDGKYYSTVYFKFTDEDTKAILSLVEKLLNE